MESLPLDRDSSGPPVSTGHLPNPIEGTGTVARRGLLTAFFSLLVLLGALSLASTAAAAQISLVLNQSAAFAVLGRDCGGIQEQVYATGFGAKGLPEGEALLKTVCNGSGRGGHSIPYTATASVVWDWYGETRTFGALAKPEEGTSTTFSATDSYGDHEYNVGTSAFLEQGAPPFQAPATPTGVSALGVRVGEEGAPPEDLQVSWTVDPETINLLTSSTITATPVGSSAPVLTATVGGASSFAKLGPAEPNTTYRVTVTSTDREGTSAPSASTEVSTHGPEEEIGEKEREEREEETLAGPPEFGHCVTAPNEKYGKATYYYGNFTSSTCLLTSATHTGKYEWEPGLTAGGFTTAIKAGTLATLETQSKVKLTCTGSTSSGLFAGRKKLLDLQITLTGCESGAQKCTSAGLAEGELQSSSLEGALGVEKTTVVNGKETKHIAVDIYPAGRKGPFMQYTCTGSAPTTLSGGLIAPVTSGKAMTSSALKFSQAAGRQKPESIEGAEHEQEQDALTNGSGEQVGLSLSSTLTTEEPIEINPVA